MNRNLPLFRVVAAMGMLLIVFGHAFISSNYQEANPAWYQYAQRAVYKFHIHLFFFISGFLLVHVHRSRSFAYGSFIRKRFIRLMVPYLFFMIINLVPNFIWHDFAAYPVRGPEDLLHILLYPKDNTIKYHWFLYTLFAVSLFTPMALYALRRPWSACLLSAVLLVLFLGIPKHSIPLLNLSSWVHFGLYYWLGMVACQWREPLFSWWKPSYAGCASLILCAGLVLAFWMLSYFIPSNLGPPHVTMAYALFGILGIGTIFALATWYQGRGWTWLSFLDGRTMTVFLLSWYGHKGADMLLHQGLGLGFYGVFPVSVCLGLLIPIVVFRIFAHRHPALDCVLGVHA